MKHFISLLAIVTATLALHNLANAKSHNGYRVLEWTDLMPKEDYDALMNPPSYLNDIADGSLEDQISSQIESAIAKAEDSAYQQALSSTRIQPELNQQKVRIPGFIVPVEFDDNQVVTHFFIVPYFGACIHLPPPPPNQIIYSHYEEGKKIGALYDAFWIEGTLSTTLVENDIAKAAYSLTVDNIAPYR